MPLKNWRGARVVEWARLESECTFYEVPRVRIPPSPQIRRVLVGSRLFYVLSLSHFKTV